MTDLRTRRRGWRRLVALVVLTAVLAACTNRAEPETTPTTAVIPPARTVLRIGAATWPSCLNPLLCDSTALREQVLTHVLPVAFEIDTGNQYRASSALAGEPVAVDGDDGSMTVTYVLSPEARWSDGRPLTSSDFAGTWRAIMTTPGADTRGYRLITDVDDTDPTTAVVRLSESWAEWRDLFGGSGGWIFQADAFGATTDLTGQFVDDLPFSAGPFQLAAWDGDVAVLTANEAYWDPARPAGVDQVRIERVDVETLGDALTYDVLLPDRTADVRTPPDFDVVAAPTARVLGVWFDQRDPLLADPLYRKTLDGIIDVAALRTVATQASPSGDAGTPVDCLGWLPDAGPWCDLATVARSDPRPDLASLVLTTEGWTPDEAGRLVRDGVFLAVTVSTDPADPATTAVADALADQLRAFGIDVVRASVDRATWRQARAETAGTGIGVYPIDVELDAAVSGLYGCLGGVASSVVAWCPEAITTASATLARALDADEQARLVTEIGGAASAEAIWIPLVTPPRPYLVKPERLLTVGEPGVWGGPLARLWEYTVAN